MLVFKRSIVGVFLCLFAISTSAPIYAAPKVSAKVGAVCPTAGKSATVGKSTLICTKQAKKLVWVAKPTSPANKYFQLIYSTDLHGSITGNANQRLIAGSTGTEITATPMSGYEFQSWSDGKVEATRTDTASKDITFFATFKVSPYTVAYSADSHGSIKGESAQRIAPGSQSTPVTATPNDGYVFDIWSDGKKDATRSDVINSSQAFAAQFKEKISAPVFSGHTSGPLLWSEEFTAISSTAIDSNSWTARNCGPATTNGGSTCMTGEVQYYAPSAVKLDGAGNLAITATHTNKLPVDAGMCGAWNSTCDFVSGRLDTQGKVSFQYGYIEARIKMPKGGANWPAFWMLGTNITSVGWPTSGEIDVVEAGGDQPTQVHGSMNFKSASGSPTYVTAIETSPSDISADFHTYGVLWVKDSISFYFDGKLYATQTPSTLSGATWTFNAPFFIILNNAIGWQGAYYGGYYDGWQTSTMSIDYVRAWQIDGQGTVIKP